MVSGVPLIDNLTSEKMSGQWQPEFNKRRLQLSLAEVSQDTNQEKILMSSNQSAKSIVIYIPYNLSISYAPIAPFYVSSLK